MTHKTEISGITDKDLPDLVAGAKVVTASPLDAFVAEVLGTKKPVDAGSNSSHLNSDERNL